MDIAHGLIALSLSSEHFHDFIAQMDSTETNSSPAVTEALRSGSVFRDPFTDGSGEGPEMVVIPPGTFAMGSPESEEGREADEGPQHTRNIASFAMGKYEVTFAQWDACFDAGGCKHNPDDDGYNKGQRPVRYVSWDDVQEYIIWLSKKTGERYRLPSEAEQEYAIRAGSKQAYPWGSRFLEGCRYLNGDEVKTKCTEDRYPNTAPVGMGAANEFGLHDIVGNVSEWAQDCYFTNYEGAPFSQTSRAGESNCKRVLRGGGWSSWPTYLRSAYRGNSDNRRLGSVGFRLAQDP
jgi:formylglycine-generating enzyme required for sulfatase activity